MRPTDEELAQRRMFAAAALEGMLGCDHAVSDRKNKAEWARIAFDWADAMAEEHARRVAADRKRWAA